MSLPEDWHIRPLVELAKRGTGHTPDKKVPENWGGNIAWVGLQDSSRLDQVFISETTETITERGIAKSSAVLYPAGVVILSRDAGVGQCAVTTRPLAVSQHFAVWNCGPELHNLFLYYSLQVLKPELERIANGSTIKTIGLPYFEKLCIALPPLPEQVEIARILTTWDNAVSQLSALIAAKTRLKRALLQVLVAGERRFPEFEGQAWRTVALGDVLQSTLRPVEWDDNATYRLASIRRNSAGLFWREELRGQDIKVKRLHTLCQGDFLVSHIQAAYGAMGCVPAGFAGGTVSDMYSILTPKDPTQLDIRFIDLLSQMPQMRQLVLLSSNGFFAERLRLNFDPIQFLKQTISLPPTLEEQQRIAQGLEAATREIQLLQAQLQALKEQKRGLMQSLLSGNIRVGGHHE